MVGGGAEDEPDRLWAEVLDFVDRLAAPLGLSGWSVGVVDGEVLHTHNRGFGSEVSARYAELPREVHLPGPVTVATGEDQYFPTRESAHRLYPLTEGIDADSEHHAVAVLGLRPAAGPPSGYLALHFLAPQAFAEEYRRRLTRLADSVASALPVGPPGPRHD